MSRYVLAFVSGMEAGVHRQPFVGVGGSRGIRAHHHG